MHTPKNITLILIFTIIVFYFTTDEKSKLFNTRVWPIQKSERINKAISYNIIDHERDITLIDPYSITHISHGIILFLLFNKFNKGDKYNFYYALFIEILWEILENIESLYSIYNENLQNLKVRPIEKRYLKYKGDSIVNILTDIIFMIIGYNFSQNPNIQIILLIIFETLCYLKIKDNLLLCIIELVLFIVNGLKTKLYSLL